MDMDKEDTGMFCRDGLCQHHGDHEQRAETEKWAGTRSFTWTAVRSEDIYVPPPLRPDMG